MTELADFFERLDLDAADALYQRLSVDPERVRRTLRTAGRAYVQQGSPAPSPENLRRTGRWLTEQTALKAGTLGGIAGLTGAASVPVEIAGQVVAIVRLAQRLAVVYGFDPSCDRGRTVLWRALAGGLDVPLPSHGPVGMRFSDLRQSISKTPPRGISSALAQALVRRTTRSLLSRILRIVPLAGSLGNMRMANRRVLAIGDRMLDVFDRLYEPELPVDVLEATEV